MQADEVLEQMADKGFAPDTFTIASYCTCARLTVIDGECDENAAAAAARDSQRGDVLSQYGKYSSMERLKSGGGGWGVEEIQRTWGDGGWYGLEDEEDALREMYWKEDEDQMYGLEHVHPYFSSSSTPSGGSEEEDNNEENFRADHFEIDTQSDILFGHEEERLRGWSAGGKISALLGLFGGGVLSVCVDVGVGVWVRHFSISVCSCTHKWCGFHRQFRLF